MTNDQLLTWLRQRLPKLDPTQLPDPTIDLNDPNLNLKDRDTLRQVVHAGLTVLAQTSPSHDARRGATDRLNQLRAADRRARGRRIERPEHLRALQRPVRIIGLTPPLNSRENVRIANARELALLMPGIDPELSRLTDDEQEQLADLLRRARRPQSQPLTVPRKPLEPAPEPCNDDQALARLDDLIEILIAQLAPGDLSVFDLGSDELVSHDVAVDFALGTITEIADGAPSDDRRLSALNVLGRLLGPEHIRNRLMRLANTTKSDATRLSAVYVLSRGLGIVGPIAPRKPEEPRIEMIHVWPASARELEEIRQRDTQAETHDAPRTQMPPQLPPAARRSPHPTPRDPLPRLPTPAIPRFKHSPPIHHNPRSQHPTPNSHEPAPPLDPPTSPPSTSPPQRPRHIDALPSIITAGPVTIVNEPP